MRDFVGWTEILGKTYLGEVFHDYEQCADEVIKDKAITGIDLVFYYGHSKLGAEGADFDNLPDPVLGGEQGFRKMYYTGARLTAPEAVEIGFVDRTCAMENLLPESIEFAAELARKKKSTYAEMKKRYRGEIARILDEEDPKFFKLALKGAIPS